MMKINVTNIMAIKSFHWLVTVLLFLLYKRNNKNMNNSNSNNNSGTSLLIAAWLSVV
jgi:hypothetical protein